MAILSAARNQRNISLFKEIFERFKKNFPNADQHRVSASVLLANTYSLIGNEVESLKIRKKIDELGVKKKGGRSWTFINNKVVVSIHIVLLKY